MKKLILALPIALGIGFAAPAHATTIFQTEAECPDGSTMSVVRIGSYTTFGQRIDGQPIGTLEFPISLDICEDGFILYKSLDDFDRDELARAQAIVATPEYRAILATGPSYLALHHIYEEMEQDPTQTLYMLMQAGWQVDEDRERYEELLGMLIEEAAPVLESIGPENSIYTTILLRVVNAHRVRGEFEAAAERLAQLREVAANSEAETPSPEYYDFVQSLIESQNREIGPQPPEAE